MSSTPRIVWTDAALRRYRWMVDHLNSCTACVRGNEDAPTELCPEADHFNGRIERAAPAGRDGGAGAP